MTSSPKRKLPPDPRTVAEMIPVRQAEIKARGAKPRCHVKGHGVMIPRDLAKQTYEQMWCGVWYDCQAQSGTHKCGSSASYPSRELAAYHGEPYSTGSGYELWDGEQWQPISDAENQRLFDERRAERDRSDAAMRAAAHKPRTRARR